MSTGNVFLPGSGPPASKAGDVLPSQSSRVRRPCTSLPLEAGTPVNLQLLLSSVTMADLARSQGIPLVHHAREKSVTKFSPHIPELADDIRGNGRRCLATRLSSTGLGLFTSCPGRSDSRYHVFTLEHGGAWCHTHSLGCRNSVRL